MKQRSKLISTPARRYARALLEVAIGHGRFTTVLEDLENFQKQMEDLSVLRQLFLNPAVTSDKKNRILDQLGKKLGFQPLTLNFLKTIIRRHRLNLLDQIITSAQQQFLERQGIMVVEVITARKLDAGEEDDLISRLEQFTGKKVQLENHVDPSVIGGVITRIGSTLYDGSVQAQLKVLKRRMIES